MCVFKRDLKMSMEGATFTAIGSVFQSLGAATEKARSPFDVCVYGMFKIIWSADLSVLFELGGVMRAAM